MSFRWWSGSCSVGELAMASAIAGSPAATAAGAVDDRRRRRQNTAGIQNRVVWPTLMAQRTGWSVSNFALPDAGFAADGMGGQAFTYQVDRAQAGRPQVILIVDGTADASVPEMEAVTRRGRRRDQQDHPRWRASSGGRCRCGTKHRFRNRCRRVNDAVRKVAEEAGVPVPRCSRSAFAHQGSDARRPQRTE